MVGVTFQALLARGATAPATRTYVGRVSTTVDNGVFTFAGASIGTAAADRLVVVVASTVVNGAAERSIIGVNIGGVAATSVANAHTAATFSSNCAIFQLAVAAGTTATIEVDNSGTMSNCAVDVYALYGLGSTTAFHANTNSGTTDTNSISTTLNVPGNGIIIAGTCFFVSTSFTWTGATEDADAAVEALMTQSAASLQSASVETGRTMSVTAGTSNDRRCIAVASWS